MAGPSQQREPGIIDNWFIGEDSLPPLGLGTGIHEPLLTGTDIIESFIPSNDIVNLHDHQAVTYNPEVNREQPDLQNEPTSVLELNNPQFKTDLREFLSHDADGRTILDVYRRQKQLSEPMSRLLSRTIIKREKHRLLAKLDPGAQLEEFIIPSRVLDAYADDIVTLFGGSKGIYYTPYRSDGRISVNASGRLVEHVKYTRRKLVLDGLLVSPKKVGTIEWIPTDNDTEKITWLSNNIDPWDTVQSLWSETFAVRRAKFDNDNSSIAEYYQQYKGFRTQMGYQLIEHDFNQLYPGKASTVSTDWTVLRECLKGFLINQKITDPEAAAYVALLSVQSRVDQDALVLLLLTYVITPTQQVYIPPSKRKRNVKSNREEPHSQTYKTTKRKNKRPSAIEARQAFILHVEIAADLENSLESKRAELRRNKDTLQPLVVFVGPITQPEAFYVVIDQTRYQANSSIHSIDLAFKIFHAIDCQYPQQCFHIWLFIQRVLYQLIHPGDKFGISLETLIGKVEKTLNRK